MEEKHIKKQDKKVIKNLRKVLVKKPRDKC